jgi:hypothetical protein
MAYIPRQAISTRIPFSLDRLEDIYKRALETGNKGRFECELRRYYKERGIDIQNKIIKA